MDSINLRDIKRMRIERHWSQEQLAEMSGLSIRTIQRIEKGENAGLESLKALAAVFEVTLVDSDKNEEQAQIDKEQKYIENVKGFYKMIAIAVLSLSVFFILALVDTEAWSVFLYMLILWALVIGIYAYQTFDFFGEKWKNKLIDKKFKKD
ncbi:MAG: helix-turn-helix domain-containing protein [Flavobacteriaceae bacterium]